MDSFNNGSTYAANNSFHGAGGNNENEPSPEMASNFRKQLPTKNFMSPTISAANKAASPKRKILAERLDFVEQTRLSSKGLNFPADDVEKDFVGKSSLQPYDPVKNYLSPRPKFLRYNPNRRRKIFVLQGNEEVVKSNNSFDARNGIPSSELELGLGSGGSEDSCSPKESVEAEDKIDEGELEDEEEEEEIVEFKEDNWWSIKYFFKVLFVAVAVVLTTRAICQMNSPTPSHTRESMLGFNDLYNNGYGVEHLNFSGVFQDSITEADLMVGRLKEEAVYHDYEGPSMVETIKEISDVASNEVENNETEVILDEMLSNQENADRLQWIENFQEQEIIAATEVIEIDNIEAEIKVHDEMFREDSKADEMNSQLTTDADSEIAKDMEEVVEEEINDDTETTQMSIRLTSLDLIGVATLGVLMLVLTSFGVMYHSKLTKSSSPVTTTVAKENNVAEKEEIMDLEPSPNPSCLIQQIDEETLDPASLQIDVSKETSLIYAPSVELLGEFVFGDEVTSSFKSYTTKDDDVSEEADGSNSLIQATTVSHTVKKQMRKKTETSSIVTPSPVRRSSRLQSRRSAMSP